MRQQLKYIVVLLFMVTLAAAQTAIADPVTVELAENNPPADPGDPPPPLAPSPLINCNGYFDLSCQVCCPETFQPCSAVTSSSVLQTLISAGCSFASGNDCGGCAAPPSQACIWMAETYTPYVHYLDPTYAERRDVPSCFVNYFDPLCQSSYDSIIATLPIETLPMLAPFFAKQTPDVGIVQYPFCPYDLAVGPFIGAPLTYDRWNLYYMDENCRWTQPSADTKLCGFVQVTSVSPISLLWEEVASLEDGMTVVPFSLDARQPEAFTLWKASGKAPLLVFDPSHSGKVTSAKQLFGTYTFGGRTTKVAYSPSDKTRTPWGNGYQALALLDSNHDGKISGKELDALALWFDRNRDGVSQPGEVESLSSHGVVALYYKPNRTDPKSGDIQADLGFERLINGKLVKGASVDWFTQTFPTRQQAMIALSAIFQHELDISDAAFAEAGMHSVSAQQHDDPLKFRPHPSKNHREDLSGYWYWTVKEKGGENHPGLFALEQGRQDITGYSIIEAQLAKNDQHLRSAVTALPATGTIRRNEDGKVQLAMKIVDRKSGSTAQHGGAFR